VTFESRQKWDGVYGDLDKLAVQQAAAGIAVKVGPHTRSVPLYAFTIRKTTNRALPTAGCSNRIAGTAVHDPCNI
jgi:hypothetical protein